MEPMMYPDEQEHFLQVIDALPDHSHIVEFGSGGSTYQIGLRLKEFSHLFSVEHNLDWFEKVRDAIKDLPARQRIHRRLTTAKWSIQQDGFAQPGEENPCGIDKYLHPTFNVSLDWSNVNFVLVDGIARSACLAVLATKLKAGTTVYLHDYKGRELWYDWAVALYDRVSLTNMLLELRVR